MKNYEATTILCEAFHINKEDLEYDTIIFKEDEIEEYDMNDKDLQCKPTNVRIVKRILSLDWTIWDFYHYYQLYMNIDWQEDKDKAMKKIDFILNGLMISNSVKAQKLAETILNWYDEILNYFNNPMGIKISDAIAEGVNSQIKLLINNSRGMSNFNRLRKRVLFYFHEKDKREFLLTKKWVDLPS